MANVLTIPDWLAADRSWLAAQPGMTPWAKAANRIASQISSWHTTYVRELNVADPGHDCHPKLWACWAHHWQTAIEKHRQPTDGWVVAANIQRGQGFRKNGQLGGNVLRDVILAQAMLLKDDRAVRRFEAEYQDTIARQVLAVRRSARSDPGWWNDLLATLVGVQREDRPGRLAKFSGQSGLAPWTVTVAIRLLTDTSASGPRSMELTHDTPDSASGRTGTIRSILANDCVEFLSQRIRDAIATLPARERLALRLSIVDGQQGQQIARFFRINPGNVSRLLQSARDGIAVALARNGAGESNDACFESLVEGHAESTLADAVRDALEAAAEIEP